MKNIFQGNNLIRKCIADSLGYTFDENKDEFRFPWFTRDIYFSAFFYLTNRFGNLYLCKNASEHATIHSKLREWFKNGVEFSDLQFINGSYTHK